MLFEPTFSYFAQHNKTDLFCALLKLNSIYIYNTIELK
jgi:hypothetical protein